jgi:Right handed beta helix region
VARVCRLRFPGRHRREASNGSCTLSVGRSGVLAVREARYHRLRNRRRREAITSARASITFGAIALTLGALGLGIAQGNEAPRVLDKRPTGSALPARLGWSRGRVYYVSTRGSDRDAGTRVRPWRTIQRALNTLAPGQVAYVRGGTYQESLVMRRAGTARGPITVRSYPHERPIVHPGGSGSMDFPLRVTAGAAYFRFQGFVLEDQAHHNNQNVWISDGQRYSGPPPTHHIEISNCEVRNGISTGILVSPHTAAVHLIGNVVHDNGDGVHQHQGIYFQGQNGLIANNVVYRQPNGFGIVVRGNYPDSDTEVPIAARNVIVTHNTSVENSLSGIVVENNATRITVVNNISAYNGSHAVRGYNNDSGEILPGNVAFNNLGFGNRSGQFGNERGKVVDFSRGNLSFDPRFVNPGARDFRLAARSPALDRADRRYSLPVSFGGRTRARGSRPDLGAFER